MNLLRPRASRFLRALPLVLVASSARADFQQEWIASLPLGASLSAGMGGMVVDAAGVTYVTGSGGSSSNTEVVTAAFAPDGSLLWSQAFNGQARGIALGPGGVVYACGNTPGPGSYANVLLLKYDAQSGALLDTIQHSSGPNTSEHAASVATDALGNVYLAGGTVGDGSDVLVLKFDASGNFVWQREWDGPAWGPYSQDHGLQVLVHPDGDPVVMIHGVMNSNHPDYVVVKYAAADGATVWEGIWGVNGGDFATDMEIDTAGDVYVTGTGIDFNDKYSTIKLRGSDGALLWQEYDQAGNDNSARALALDGQGGVYITGAVDPEGDHSNFNDNIYTVKRNAQSGAQVWTFLYGANCVGCYDVSSDVVADASGHVFVGGHTSSPPYSGDMIVFVLDASNGAELDRSVISGGGTETAASSVLRFDGAYNLFSGGLVADFNTGGKSLSVVKYPSVEPLIANYCSTAPNSFGPGALIGATGSTSISANDFTLTGTGAAANQFGLYFYGPEVADAPFGDGFLCVSGGFFRLDPVIQANGSGASSRRVDFGAPPANAGPGTITAGSHWNFQLWYRDPAANGAGFNLSDALAVDFLP